MRYTSHLDLYRAWERLLRRAGAQLVFSQGYNPRPKLQLAAPLALGITSQAEIIDFWLSDAPNDLDQLKSELIRHRNSDHRVHRCISAYTPEKGFSSELPGFLAGRGSSDRPKNRKIIGFRRDNPPETQ